MSVSGLANAAADGDESTDWHTAWSSGSFQVSEESPAIITVDLGADYDILGIKFMQRKADSQTGSGHCHLGEYWEGQRSEI